PASPAATDSPGTAVPAPDRIVPRPLAASAATPPLPALARTIARGQSPPDGTRLPDRSPALLLHQSSRSGFAGFRDGAPTLPGFAPAPRHRASLAGETRLVCCMPNRPIRAVPKTTAAPAQTIVARDAQRNS